MAAARDASPTGGAFFDSLAQFYRKAYLRWIEATKRRPEQRPARIPQMIRLLEAGKKERPQPWPAAALPSGDLGDHRGDGDTAGLWLFRLCELAVIRHLPPRRRPGHQTADVVRGTHLLGPHPAMAGAEQPGIGSPRPPRG